MPRKKKNSKKGDTSKKDVLEVSESETMKNGEFLPTDEECVGYLLTKNGHTALGIEIPRGRIIEFDFYKFHPQQLYERYSRDVESDEKALYFFCPRKSENETELRGIWIIKKRKVAIGPEGRTFGTKRMKVFYCSTAKRLTWIIHAYKIPAPPTTPEAPRPRAEYNAQKKNDDTDPAIVVVATPERDD